MLMITAPKLPELCSSSIILYDDGPHSKLTIRITKFIHQAHLDRWLRSPDTFVNMKKKIAKIQPTGLHISLSGTGHLSLTFSFLPLTKK